MVPGMLVLPNFFIIGAPKCGTTALSEYLRTHPNVFLSDPKEPEYFATDFPSRIIRREEDYLRLFHSANPATHLAIGEASTIYLFSQDALPNILKFNPDARLIAMLRNPVDLVISFHAHLVSEGVENIVSFADAWEAEKERRQGKRIPPTARNPQWLYYSEWGKLGTQLQRALTVVAQNQMKIILYDDFIKDVRNIYVETLAFLGLPDDGRLDFPVINERRRPRNIYLQSILGIISRWWLPLRVYVTGGRGLGLGRFLRLVTTAPMDNKNIPLAVRKMLIDYYQEEILLLEQLLDRDLSHWRK